MTPPSKDRQALIGGGFLGHRNEPRMTIGTLSKAIESELWQFDKVILPEHLLIGRKTDMQKVMDYIERHIQNSMQNK